jgi:hypothetical protein
MIEVLWTILGILVYLAIGICVSRLVSRPYFTNEDRACHAIFWPYCLILLCLTKFVDLMGYLSGGK